MYYYYIYAETFMDDINTHSLNHTYMYMYIYICFCMVLEL